MRSPIEVILAQPIAHLACYILTLFMLFKVVWHGCLVKELKTRLLFERELLRVGDVSQHDLSDMVHPIAKGLQRFSETVQPITSEMLARTIELREHVLFSPLRHSIMLARDVSTLVGLVSTCVGLVTAAVGFAQQGKPELMVGSIGTAAIGTIIAGVACMISLCNCAKLADLRLLVVQDSDEWLLDPFETHAKPAITVRPVEQNAPVETASSDRTTSYEIEQTQ